MVGLSVALIMMHFWKYYNIINWKNVFGTTTCPNLLMDLFLNTLNDVLDLMATIKLLTRNEINSNSKLGERYRFGVWRRWSYNHRRPATIGNILRRLASVSIMASGVYKLHFLASSALRATFKASRVHYFIASSNSIVLSLSLKVI